MPKKRKSTFIPLIIDPPLLLWLLPELLALKDREISQRQHELQVLIQLHQYFFDHDIGKALKLGDEERSVVYPLLERLCDHEEEQIRDRLERLEEQKQALLEMQQQSSTSLEEKKKVPRDEE